MKPSYYQAFDIPTDTCRVENQIFDQSPALVDQRLVRADQSGVDTLWLEVSYKGSRGTLAYNSEPSELFHHQQKAQLKPAPIRRRRKSTGLSLVLERIGSAFGVKHKK